MLMEENSDDSCVLDLQGVEVEIAEWKRNPSSISTITRTILISKNICDCWQAVLERKGEPQNDSFLIRNFLHVLCAGSSVRQPEAQQSVTEKPATYQWEHVILWIILVEGPPSLHVWCNESAVRIVSSGPCSTCGASPCRNGKKSKKDLERPKDPRMDRNAGQSSTR